MTSMRVAAGTMDVLTGDVDANLLRAKALLHEAADEGVQLLALPEMWPTSFVAAASPEDLARSARAVEALAAEAHPLGVALVGSAFGPSDASGRPSNRLHLLVGGEVHLLHDKEHLFSPTAEHLVFRGGVDSPRVVPLGGLSLSGLICYDLRFPEVALAATRAGAELLVVVAQWPVPRATHWEALLVGRAVEGQCWVLGCNRSGAALIGRRQLQLDFPGNAMLVAPDGRVVARGDGTDALLVADLDVEEARELRRLVPVAQDAARRARRED